MNLRNSLLRGFAPAVSALALAAMVSTTAHAQSVTDANLGGATNANKQITGFAGSNSSVEVSLAGWTNTGYSFVMTSPFVAVPDSTGAGDTVKLDPGVSGFSVPGGGNFLALDADAGYNGTTSTTITGLTIGANYTVTFDYAASQQANTDGTNYYPPTYDNLTVGVGTGVGSASQVYNITDPNANTTLFQSETLNFTANLATETLSFSALGGQLGNTNNVPAFALVDAISVAPAPQAPEPNSLILLGTGLAGLGGLVRSRFVKATTKA